MAANFLACKGLSYMLIDLKTPGCSYESIIAREGLEHERWSRRQQDAILPASGRGCCHRSDPCYLDGKCWLERQKNSAKWCGYRTSRVSITRRPQSPG